MLLSPSLYPRGRSSSPKQQHVNESALVTTQGYQIISFKAMKNKNCLTVAKKKATDYENDLPVPTRQGIFSCVGVSSVKYYKYAIKPEFPDTSSSEF